MLPLRIEITNFIRRIKVSDKQMAKYYKWTGSHIKGAGKKIPKSFFKNKLDIPSFPRIEDLKDEFVIAAIHKTSKKIISTFRDTTMLPSDQAISRHNFLLCVKDPDGEIRPILCNPKKVGTPRHYLIRGQDIYSGNLREHFKGMVMDKIKECYLPFVKDLAPITNYPVKIDCELHDTIKNAYDKTGDLGQRWDIDNFAYPYVKAFPDLLVTLKILKDDDRLHLPQSIGTRFIPIEDHNDRKLVFIISKEDRPEILNNKIYNDFHKEVVKEKEFYGVEVPVETTYKALTYEKVKQVIENIAFVRSKNPEAYKEAYKEEFYDNGLVKVSANGTTLIMNAKEYRERLQIEFKKDIKDGN